MYQWKGGFCLMGFGRVFILYLFSAEGHTFFLFSRMWGSLCWLVIPTTGVHGRSGPAPRSPPRMLRFGGFGKGLFCLCPTELKFYRCFNQGQTLMPAGYVSSGSGFQKKPSAKQRHLGNPRESRALVCAWGNVGRSSRKDSDPDWT